MESEKAKLRQRILAGESDINTLSGFDAMGTLQILDYGLPTQHPMHAHSSGSVGYSNHDLLTPVNTPGGYAGTTQGKSMTSTSSRSMQRFFRRKGDAVFDDETGADISDVAAEMTFQDITHIRGNGRYNTSYMQSLDTLPIIPVVGGTGSTANPKNLNNIQYRKYMNHQKKLNYANGARAMSLAGSNPMSPMHLMSGPDPRSMSFGGPQDGRTMSLGGQMNQMANGPRTMSLNSNAMLWSQGQMPMNGPRVSGPMGPGNPQMNQMNMAPMQTNQMNMKGMQMNQMHVNPQYLNMGPRVPHAQSLRGGNPLNLQFRGPPPNMRNNSLGGMGMAGPQGYSAMGSRAQSLTQGIANPPTYKMIPGRPPPQPYHLYQQNSHNRFQGTGDYLAPRPPQNNHYNSNDSLMNFAEVDEEKEYLNDNNAYQSIPLASDAFNEEEEEEDDYVYKFEDDGTGPQPSRKSTVKKSNSMRVRRLDLFKPNNGTTEEVELEDEPALHLQNTGDRLSEKQAIEDNDEEINEHPAAQTDKLNVLRDSEENDVFTRAPEFHSPQKHPPQTSIDNFAASTRELSKYSPTKSTNSKDYGTLNEQDTSKDSLDSKKRPIRLKSLTANTAFSNFRPPSSSLSTIFGLEADSRPNNEFDQPHNDKNSSETESQSSAYTSDTPKRSGTANALFSPSSEHHSPSLEQSLKLVGMPADNYEELELGQRRALPLIVNKIDKDENNGNIEDLNNIDSEVPVSHSESSRATSDTRVGLISRSPLFSTTDKVDITPLLQKRTSAISRSNSKLKMQGLLPSGNLITGTDTNNMFKGPPLEILETDKKEKRKSRTSSISTKSKSFIKRLSISGTKKNISDDVDYEDVTSANPSFGLRVPSSGSIKETKKPLIFSKEELAIMSCNNDLQNELQLVISELAMSIKRELALEAQLRNDKVHFHSSGGQTNEEEMTEKGKIIAELLEKLNNERKLRFISEEHAILSEHGQKPSALKLDYEKNEIYKQLLAKNDLVNQLQDRIEELEYANSARSDDDLLHKYNDLLRENSELRSRLENAQTLDHNPEHHSGFISSYSHGEDRNEYELAQIISLRAQRDELREVITKLTSSQNVELKVAQDRIKTLKDKLQKMNMINDKLSKRLHRGENSREAFTTGQGGKLLGFDIVSPRKKFVDK